MFGLTFENVYIKSKDSTRLHIFFVKQVTEALTASSPTILYLHGNAGNIGHRLMNVKGLVQMLGCNVCLLEYRGYGHSDGSPHEEGLYLDAQAALEYLIGRPDVDQRKIIVFGRSLGKQEERKKELMNQYVQSTKHSTYSIMAYTARENNILFSVQCPK